jgi:hypothetical protein
MPDLLNALLTIWEHAIKREATLKLILNDVAPDWRHHYQVYWDDPGTLEHAQITTAPMRSVVAAAIRGELTHSLLQQAIADIQKKSN